MQPGYFCPVTESMIAMCVGTQSKTVPKRKHEQFFVLGRAKTGPVTEFSPFILERQDVEEIGKSANGKDGRKVAIRLLRGLCCRRTKIQERTL